MQDVAESQETIVQEPEAGSNEQLLLLGKGQDIREPRRRVR